jgi:hypothetical protein
VWLRREFLARNELPRHFYQVVLKEGEKELLFSIFQKREAIVKLEDVFRERTDW